MQALILVAIITFTFETVPDLSPAALKTLRVVESSLLILFTAEYVLRVVVARSKARFIFSPFGIIDLLAILPFYIAMGIDLRSLRVLRWFRIFRALKLLRYSRALRHFVAALNVIKEQFVVYLMATGLMIYFAAAGIYYFEHQAQPDTFKSIFHCVWWSVVTLTSVGYGDMYPVTVGGRIFTCMLLPIGLGVLTVPAGLIAFGLTQAKARHPHDDD